MQEDFSTNHALKYMMEKYQQTRWNFFFTGEVLEYGTKDELNNLWKAKKIKLRDNIHGKVIELIL